MSLTKATNRMIDGAYVSVVDYGADPTGTQDSSVAIQAAVDATRETSFQGGGILYFPSGTYKVSNTINLHTKMKILGNNSAIQPDADLTKSIFLFENSSGLVGEITIQDFWIYDTYSGVPAVACKCKHFIEFKSTGGGFYNIKVSNIYSARSIAMKSVVGFTGLRENIVPDIIEIGHIDVSKNPLIPWVVSLEKDAGATFGSMGSLNVHHIDQSYRCTTGQYFYDMDNFAEVGRGFAGGVLVDGCRIGVGNIFGPWLYANPYLIKGVNGAKISRGIIYNGSVEYANIDKSDGSDASPYAINIDLNNCEVQNIRVYNNANEFASLPRAYYGVSKGSRFINLALQRVRTPAQPIAGSDDLIYFDTGSTQNYVSRFEMQSVDAISGAITEYPNSITSDYVTGTLTKTEIADPQSVVSFSPVVEGSTSAGSGTYTTQSGVYVKTGRVINFHINLEWTAHTGTGNIEISGLPFTNTGIEAAITVGPKNNYTLNANSVLDAFVDNNDDVIYFRQVTTGGGVVSGVALDTAASLTLSGSYITET